jgi:hypothetical protein
MKISASGATGDGAPVSPACQGRHEPSLSAKALHVKGERRRIGVAQYTVVFEDRGDGQDFRCTAQLRVRDYWITPPFAC